MCSFWVLSEVACFSFCHTLDVFFLSSQVLEAEILVENPCSCQHLGEFELAVEGEYFVSLLPHGPVMTTETRVSQMSLSKHLL